MLFCIWLVVKILTYVLNKMKTIFGGRRGWRTKCATPPKIQAKA